MKSKMIFLLPLFLMSFEAICSSSYITPLINKIAQNQRLSVEKCQKKCINYIAQIMERRKILHELYQGMDWNRKTRKHDIPYMSSTFYLTGGKNPQGKSCMLKVVYNYDVKGKRMSWRHTAIEVTSMALVSTVGEYVGTASTRQIKEKSNSLEISYKEGNSFVQSGKVVVSNNSVQGLVSTDYRQCAKTKEDWLGKEYCAKSGKLNSEKYSCKFD